MRKQTNKLLLIIAALAVILIAATIIVISRQSPAPESTPSPTPSSSRKIPSPLPPVVTISPTTPEPPTGPDDGSSSGDDFTQADEIAETAALAMALQPPGETSSERASRLMEVFVIGSPAISAPAPVTEDVSELQVEPVMVQWTAPFDAGEGRYGLMVSVQIQVAGRLDADTGWQSLRSQLWRIELVQRGGLWKPDNASLDEDD